MPGPKIKLIPPMKGFQETTALSEQPAGTSAAILNTVLLDPATDRFRAASRPGSDLFDLFNFNDGSTINIPTVIVAATGGGGIGVVQIPNVSCQPFTVGTSSPTLDICGAIGGTISVDTITGVTTVTPLAGTNGTCQPISLILCGQPNNSSGPTTGSIFIGGPGGSGGGGGAGGVEQGPCPTPPCAPVSDPDRPWLACYPCSELNGTHSSVSFWVHESVNEIYNSLAVLRDIQETTSTFDSCFYVSGQRTETPNYTRSISDFATYITCGDCASPGIKYCYYVFRQVFNCDTQTWGEVSSAESFCIASSLAPTPNTWVYFESDGNNRIYKYFKQGSLCVDGNDCLIFPAAPEALTETPDTCAAYDSLVIRIYTKAGDVLQATRVVNHYDDEGCFGSFLGSPTYNKTESPYTALHYCNTYDLCLSNNVYGWHIRHTGYDAPSDCINGFSHTSSDYINPFLGRYDHSSSNSSYYATVSAS